MHVENNNVRAEKRQKEKRKWMKKEEIPKEKKHNGSPTSDPVRKNIK